MALSEFAIRNAKPREKPYRLADSEGLHLFVQPHGSKSWQLRYRFLGKENALSFCKYPLVTLAEARKRRDEAKKLLSDGVYPAPKRKLDKIAAENAAHQTFGLIAEEYIERLRLNVPRRQRSAKPAGRSLTSPNRSASAQSRIYIQRKS